MAIGAEHVLAGPIVRRTEPTLASVWIVLSKPATVRLQLHRGVGVPSTLGPAIAGVTPPAVPAGERRGLTPDTHTLALGANLHVALAVFEPQAQLEWGAIYSYDLRITADDGGGEVGFAELDMLRDRSITNHVGVEQPFLALGYQAGWLPSFAMPASDAFTLRFAHGSCRWASGEGKDALPILDEILSTTIGDAAQRPQMLWLTGDQIYADEVSPELGVMCNDLGTWLLAGENQPTIERIGVELVDDQGAGDPPPRVTKTFPVDREHFPPGLRRHLVFLAGFRSTDQDSQVIGFGEYAAAYLFHFSNQCWPALEPMLQARFADVRAFADAYKQLKADIATAARAREFPDDKTSELMQTLHPAWRLVPEAARALWGQMGENDQWQVWGEANSSGGDSPWSKFWLDAIGDTSADPIRYRAYSRPPVVEIGSTTLDADKRLLARVTTPPWWAGQDGFRVTIDDDGRVTEDVVRKRLHGMKQFVDDLPKVRRALANIATYMVFDDHDICDDWNISDTWVTSVRGTSTMPNTFGRSLLRNAISAVTVFQSWGNDPRAYVSSAIHREVLGNIAALFTNDDGSTVASGPDPFAAEDLERRFDTGPVDQPTPESERMFWHFRFDGAGYEILALDTRTRRSYEVDADVTVGEPIDKDANAAMMTEAALATQIPADPPVGLEHCIVVSAVPVLGYPPAETLAQPILNAIDIGKAPPTGRFKHLEVVEHYGRVHFDPEPWGYVPRMFEALLARLSNRRRVVFLSGDVHYSCMLEMSYWKREHPNTTFATTRFLQLTSSSMRAQQPIDQPQYFSMDLAQLVSLEIGRDLERLGWRLGAPGTPEGVRPVEPPAGQQFNPRTRYLLTHDPILVAPAALPPGTTEMRLPDFMWRSNIVTDRRPDEVRLDGLLFPALRPESDGTTEMLQSVADRIVWHVENAPDRQWMWWTNIALVDFMTTPTPRVRQTILTYDLAGGLPGARTYMITEAALDVASTEELPRIPEGP